MLLELIRVYRNPVALSPEIPVLHLIEHLQKSLIDSDSNIRTLLISINVRKNYYLPFFRNGVMQDSKCSKGSIRADGYL